MQRISPRIPLLTAVLLAHLPTRADPPPPDRLHEEEARERIRKELEGLDPSAVATMLRSLLEESAPLEHAFDSAAAKFAELEAQAALAKAVLEGEPAPDLSSIRPESRSWRAMKAERAWKVGSTEVAWLERRSTARQALLTLLNQVRTAAEETSAGAAGLSAHRLRLSVVREELARLRREGRFAGETVAGEHAEGEEEAGRARVKAIESRAIAAGAAAPATLAGLRNEEEKEQERRRLLAAGLPELEAAWTAAKASADWQAGMLRLESAELAAAFASAWTESQQADALAAAEREKVTAADAAARAAERELQAAPEDPIIRRAQQADPGYRSAVLADLRRRAGLPELAEVIEPRARPAPPAAADAGTLSALQAGIEARESMLASRVRVLEEQARRRTDLIAALRLLESALQAQETAHTRASDRAERAALAAAELQSRMAAGESIPGVTQETLADAVSTDRLGLLDAWVEQSRGKRREAATRLEALDRRARDARTKREGLTRLRGVASRKLENLRQLAVLEKSIQTAPAQLEENERTRLESRARLRMEREETTIEAFLAYFATGQSSEASILLTAMYTALEDLERRGKLLAQSMVLAQELVDLTDRAERTLLQEIQGPTREELDRLRADEAELLIRTGIVPTTHAESRASLQTAGRPPPAPQPPLPEEIPSTADRLFDARMRVAATEGWLADIGIRLSRLGVDADVADLQEVLGRLAVRGSAVQRDAARLAGPDASLIPGLPALSGAAELAAAPGEIAVLRESRRQVHSRSAVIAGLSIVAIPVAAWLLMGTVRILVRGFLRRAIDDREDIEKERRQRAETLVRVFQAALRTLVVAVAGIYILKQLRVDVTPLMASAGIAGLAVAFGAQPLVRDFFAGFFMLLENQYRIGDVIRIGETGGIVERITMRVTVLRDLNGVVHYIPNGNVTMVSNMTQGWSRVVLELGVAYREDPDRVMKVLREVGRELELDPTWGGCLVASPEVPGIERFADSSVVIRMMFKTRPGDQWSVAREARRRIKHAFDANGIEIPFPQRVVYHVNPKAAGPAPEPPKTDPPTASGDESWRDAETGG